MREPPKLLAAALLTLCLSSIGCVATPVAAFAARRPRNRVGHTSKACPTGRREARCRSTHQQRARVKKSRSRKPKPAIAPARTRERIPRSGRRREVEARQAEETASSESAARIAAVLATPCQNTEITPTTENLALARAAVLCLINKERAEHGVAPLVLNPDLEAAAEGHCAELIEDDYFAHIAPDGETPVQRIEDTGYLPSSEVGYVIGENLAWGTYVLSTPQAIVSAWIASPGHLANILESRYTETGLGITPAVPASLGGGNPGATYAEEFGVIIH